MSESQTESNTPAPSPQRLQATLSALLEVSPQGLLLFGPSLTVEEPVSRATLEFLGSSPVGRQVTDVLWASAESRQDFADGVALVFSGHTDPEVVFDLLESETQLGGRTLRLGYRWLEPDRVLVVLTEVVEGSAAPAADEGDHQKGLLLKAVAHRSAFGAFLRDFSHLFTHLSEPGARRDDEAGRKNLALELHTMKGNAGFFEFTRTATEAHDFEQRLAQRAPLAEAELKSHTLALKRAYYEELGVVTRFLGDRWVRDIDCVSVPLDAYLKLEAWMRKTHPDDRAMNSLLQRYRTVPFRDLLARFPDMAQSLARKLGKELHPITIEGGDFPVLPDPFESLISTLVHLVRNMVDHGIEPPQQRLDAGKSRAGLLQIRISREADALFMVFSDDGRGVNLAGVEAKARELGILPPGKKVSDESLLDLMFLAGFSTADEVTEISGRGVGLSAVKDVVTRLGGTITVHTRAGRGTSFDIMLPVQGDRS